MTEKPQCDTKNGENLENMRAKAAAAASPATAGAERLQNRMKKHHEFRNLPRAARTRPESVGARAFFHAP
jgi:hypothetical protein